MAERLAPLSIKDDYGIDMGSIDMIGQTAEAPFNAVMNSTQEDVARRVYIMAKERNKPVYFTFNRSVFVVTVSERNVKYQLVSADSNSKNMVAQYFTTFNRVGQQVAAQG